MEKEKHITFGGALHIELSRGGGLSMKQEYPSALIHSRRLR